MEIDKDLFIRGFFAGVVVVLGLGLGVKILFSTTNPKSKLSQPQLVQRYLIAALLLGGQFILSAYLLMSGSSQKNRDQNFSMGLGLVASIFLLSFLAPPFFNNNRKKH